jgi:1,4-alpha-glucan branching enzyme
MKRNKSRQSKGKGLSSAPVRLEFIHPTATAVCIAGTFNDWRPEATPMIALGNSRWLKELALPPGQYEYRLVVDGQWMSDPLARETAPNPFGGFNSVLSVAGRT